jgi:hypothetical protein
MAHYLVVVTDYVWCFFHDSKCSVHFVLKLFDLSGVLLKSLGGFGDGRDVCLRLSVTALWCSKLHVFWNACFVQVLTSL